MHKLHMRLLITYKRERVCRRTLLAKHALGEAVRASLQAHLECAHLTESTTYRPLLSIKGSHRMALKCWRLQGNLLCRMHQATKISKLAQFCSNK